jgi:hypothetical protein
MHKTEEQGKTYRDKYKDKKTRKVGKYKGHPYQGIPERKG